MCNEIDIGYGDGVTDVPTSSNDRPSDEPKVVVVGGMSPSTAELYDLIASELMDMPLIYENPRMLRESGLVRPWPKRKPEKQCQLPGCENKTTHNGGYCCADHCREHRARRGKKIKAVGR